MEVGPGTRGGYRTAPVDRVAPLPPFRVGLMAYLAAFAFTIYQLVVQTSYSPLREEIGADLALDTMQSSAISATFLVTYACMQIPAGILLDRFGATRLLPLAAGLLGGATVVFSLSGSVAGAVVGRGLMGIAAAFAFPSIGMVLRRGIDTRWFPVFMGLADIGLGLGGMIGTAGADRLAAAIGWRGAMQAAAAAAIPIAFGAWLCLPRDRFGGGPAGAARAPVLASLRTIVADRQVRLAAVIYAGGCGTLYGFGTMWNRPLSLAWSLSPDEATIVDFAFFLGVAAGAPLTGLAEVWLGARRTLAWGIVLALASFMFWAFVPIDFTVWFDAVNVAIVGAGLASTVLAFTVACRGLPAEHAATAVGVVNFAGVVSGAALQVVPGLVMRLVDHSELFRLQVSSGVIFALSLTVALVASMRLAPDGPRQ
jgi:MFS family permease